MSLRAPVSDLASAENYWLVTVMAGVRPLPSGLRRRHRAPRGRAVPAGLPSQPPLCRGLPRLSPLRAERGPCSGQGKGVASSGPSSRRSSALCRDVAVNAGRRKLSPPATRLPGHWDPAAAPHAAEPPLPGRWLRSAPAPAPPPGLSTGTGWLGRRHRSASWARFCR